jgi:hypothetical protein
MFKTSRDTASDILPGYRLGFEPISYRGAVLSTLLHATVYIYMFLHHLLNVLVQIANKIFLGVNVFAY